MTSLVESMREFEKIVTDQQTMIANKVQHSESRCLFCKLGILVYYCGNEAYFMITTFS
jgi:hypothetical protein